MSSLQLRSITKKFGGVFAISDLSLAVADGEFVALVGPSGCGKSTLLRIVAGLETESSGQIFIDGKLTNGVSPKGRNIAMVFQNYALYPHMTVAQNMGLNLKVSGVPAPEIDRRVLEVATLLDIRGFLDRRPAQLSGGQRQRVAMGRAIVRKPALFLFDEPLSNLDAKLRVQMRGEIKALHRKIRTTVLYVTHDQVEAMTLADRVVVLNKGRIEQQGTPLELYNSPRNTFVGAFIGSPSMNLLPGVIEVSSGASVASLSGGGRVPLGPRSIALEGRSVTIGLRPEHLKVADKPSGLSGHVELLELTGAQMLLTVRVSDVLVTVVTEGTFPGKPDDIIELTVRPEQVHLFDRETQERIEPA